MRKLTKFTAYTLLSRILQLGLALVASIIVARLLGPTNKGIFTLAILLPTVIVTFSSLGIGSSTIYYVARREYPTEEVMGNNIIFGLGIGSVGVAVGIAAAIYFQPLLFPGVERKYLLLALGMIPGRLLLSYLHNILLGAYRIKEYNQIDVCRSVLYLLSVLAGLLFFEDKILGVILAVVLTWSLMDVLAFLKARGTSGGVSFRFNPSYMKKTLSYGIQTYLGGVVSFLNYRVDMFLVNGFLNPTAVGFYSVGVLIVERLRLLADSAATVLFPRVAGQDDAAQEDDITPLVSRTVLWVTLFGAVVVFFLSRWMVELLFGEAFLPAVRPMKILLVGIVMISSARVLSSDIAGRGRPMVNTYIGALALVINVLLNIVWIPRYGIEGAALASTVSYGAIFICRVFVYCKLSGNLWTRVVFPQPRDWPLYWELILLAGRKFKAQLAPTVS